METRPQRLGHSQRPPHPAQAVYTASSPSSSATSSVFQTTSSLASPSSLDNNTSQHPHFMSNQAQQMSQSSNPFSSAPLPSPSANPPQSSGYFPTSHPSQHQDGAGWLAPSPTSSSSQGQSHTGQRGGGVGGAPETAPFLRDFNLVAEAAKRAQMACLARDFGDVGL